MDILDSTIVKRMSKSVLLMVRHTSLLLRVISGERVLRKYWDNGIEISQILTSIYWTCDLAKSLFSLDS